MTRVIIDCDPGLDDAVALLATFGAPGIEILGVTTVAGNVKGRQTAMNASIICAIAGYGETLPVCAGAPRPILRDPVTAEDFHGTTGLGNLDLPPPSAPLSQTHAVNFIIETCRASREQPLTLIITGPMTNVALALIMAPDIVSGLTEIIAMGGAHTEGGNITPTAEFNIFADPHAAAIVYGSGVPIRCLSLDVTHQLRTTPDRLAAVHALPSQAAQIAGDLLEASCKLEFSAKGDREAPLHDPSTILALTCPDAFTGRRANIVVVTEPGDAFGQTQPTFCEDGAVLWYEHVDADRAFDELKVHLGALR